MLIGISLEEAKKRYPEIPTYTLQAIYQYVERRRCPGHFVTAVLENDLATSVGRADKNNRRALVRIVEFVYNYIPLECWGSKEKVRKWLEG